MKANKLFYFIHILLFSQIFLSPIFTMTYYVSPKGNNQTGNGSLFAPWRTIQYTIDQAYPGDTIKIIGDGTIFAA